jgi:hypothetical protein
VVVTLPIAATSPLLVRSIVDWSRVVVDVAEDNPDRTAAEKPERTKSATRTEVFCVRFMARSFYGWLQW